MIIPITDNSSAVVNWLSSKPIEFSYAINAEININLFCVCLYPIKTELVTDIIYRSDLKKVTDSYCK